ncbi:hypothetical protein H6F74_01740 [Trichocoleus sp. FACHB-90]|uniref:DUF6816 family protein n=1 Tax=Trichocoleus sp. FACHB-90 TaxID=2692876 RepID=UPI0016878DF5|nr:hypothetical protein [Trichocoleus sp. FACHB-90]
MLRVFWSCFLVLVLLLWGGEAQAGVLAERLAHPHWEGKPPVAAAEGDLVYPDWMVGTWKVTSTLVDLVAPLAPEILTPGFESNRRYLNQPVSFYVRFNPIIHTSEGLSRFFLNPKSRDVLGRLILPKNSLKIPQVVADRAFNGLNIGRAYLGDRAILSVKVDPRSPNRQITSLRGNRQLVSIVTGRGTETPAPDKFIATELQEQIFRGIPSPYFNTVETTTAYHRLGSSIEADQVTAVYLSPQDPDYFKALERPVALYRYRLELEKSP